MEEEQLELVEFVIRVDLVNLMVPETQALVNPVNPVNPMVPETRALVNLEIDGPIADHNLHRSYCLIIHLKDHHLILNKSLKY